MRIYEKKDDVTRGKYTGIVDDFGDDVVIIKKEAEEIGPFAFAHSGITSAVIDVPIVKRGAFEGCEHLKEVIFTKNVLKIEEEAFYRCEALTSLIMPVNLVSIGKKAFARCYGIENLVFGEKLQEIEELAFASCENLITVKFNASLKKIESNAFAGCVNLSGVDFSGGNLILEIRDFSVQERFAGDVNSYIQIANSPFLECGKVKFFNFQTYAYDAEKESYRKSYNQLMRLWLTEENSISSAVIKRMLKE